MVKLMVQQIGQNGGLIFGGDANTLYPYYPEFFAVGSQGELYARLFKYDGNGIFTPYYASTPVGDSPFPYFCYRDVNGVPTQVPIPNGTYYLLDKTDASLLYTNQIYSSKLYNSNVELDDFNHVISSTVELDNFVHVISSTNTNIFNYSSDLYLNETTNNNVINYHNSRAVKEGTDGIIENLGVNAFSIINYKNIQTEFTSENMRSYVAILSGNNIINWNTNETFFVGKSNLDNGINLSSLWEVNSSNVNFHNIQIHYDTGPNRFPPADIVAVFRNDGQWANISNKVTIKDGKVNGSTSWDDWGPIFGGIQNGDMFTPYYKELFAVGSQGELYARLFKYDGNGIFTPYYSSTYVGASYFPYFCYRDANGVPTQTPIPNGTYYLLNVMDHSSAKLFNIYNGNLTCFRSKNILQCWV
jgi:hypothetical protein